MDGLVDLHCHILPDVDDGADNLEETRRLLQMESNDGVRTVIFTPHYRGGMFETSMERILESYEMAKNIAGRLGIDTYLGCEYHVGPELLRDFKEKRHPTLAGSDFILTEFSHSHSFSTIQRIVYEAVSQGYHPVLAHIERYPCLADIEKVELLSNMGGYIQVNAGSILGEDGRRLKGYCKTLMKRNLIHFVGSDCHHVNERMPNLGKCYRHILKKMGNAYAQQIFCRNPREIIGGS